MVFCKKKKEENGFSLIEVLVTILVISGFFLGSLQATVLATLLRVQAQDKQEAANWIQQDLELIRYNAFILNGGTAVPANCGNYGDALLNDPTNGLLQPTSNPRFPTNQGVQINNKWYRVFRQYTVRNNILGITYTVAYSPVVGGFNTVAHPRYNSNASYTATSDVPPAVTNPNVVSTLSTEVIPNAALNCP